MKWRTVDNPKFKQAALAYLIYGLLYEGFAVWALLIRSPGPHAPREYSFLVIGFIILLLFPFLLQRGYVWFVRVLIVLVGFRALSMASLLLGFEMPQALSREGILFERVSGTGVYLVGFLAPP